jgi:hypothetical protein
MRHLGDASEMPCARLLGSRCLRLSPAIFPIYIAYGETKRNDFMSQKKVASSNLTHMHHA